MKLVTKQMFGALAFAGITSVFSMGTQAATALDVSTTGTATFSNSFAGITSFVDEYTFAITEPSTAGANAISSFKITFSPLTFSQGIEFTALTLSNGVDVYTGFSVTPDNSIWYVAAPFLSADDWTLTVAGNTLTTPSSYAGTITVSAVPEAETYVMMLAGVGLMGFVARRRKSAYAAA